MHAAMSVLQQIIAPHSWCHAPCTTEGRRGLISCDIRAVRQTRGTSGWCSTTATLVSDACARSATMACATCPTAWSGAASACAWYAAVSGVELGAGLRSGREVLALAFGLRGAVGEHAQAVLVRDRAAKASAGYPSAPYVGPGAGPNAVGGLQMSWASVGMRVPCSTASNTVMACSSDSLPFLLSTDSSQVFACALLPPALSYYAEGQKRLCQCVTGTT